MRLSVEEKKKVLEVRIKQFGNRYRIEWIDGRYLTDAEKEIILNMRSDKSIQKVESLPLAA
jgi:hypothetical protein